MNPITDTLKSAILLRNTLTRLNFYCTVLINLRLRYVRKVIFAVEKQYFLHILSVCLSPDYAACKIHVPYYIVISGLSASTTVFKSVS